MVRIGVGDILTGDYSSDKAAEYTRRRTETICQAILSKPATSLDDVTTLANQHSVSGADKVLLETLREQVPGPSALVDPVLEGVPYTRLSVIQKRNGRYVVSDGRNIEGYLGLEVQPGSLSETAIRERLPKISGRNAPEPSSTENGDSYMVFPIINGADVLGVLNVKGNGFKEAHHFRGKAASGLLGHYLGNASAGYRFNDSDTQAKYGRVQSALSGLSALYRSEISDLMAHHLSNGSSPEFKDNVVESLTLPSDGVAYVLFRDRLFAFVKKVSENPRKFGLSSFKEIGEIDYLAKRVKSYEEEKYHSEMELQMILARFKGMSKRDWNSTSDSLGPA